MERHQDFYGKMSREGRINMLLANLASQSIRQTSNLSGFGGYLEPSWWFLFWWGERNDKTIIFSRISFS